MRRWQIATAVLLGILATDIAFADRKRTPKVETAATEPQDDDEHTVLEVPESWRDRGYRLRNGDQVYPLDRAAFAAEDDGEPTRLYLLGREGLILDNREETLRRDALRQLKPRSWRIGMAFGPGKIVRGSYASIYAPNRMNGSEFSAVYQPNVIGWVLGLRQFKSEEVLGEDLLLKHGKFETMVGVQREFAALGRYLQNPHWQRLQLTAQVAVVYVDQQYELTDLYSEVTARSRTFGGHTELGLRVMIIGGLWFTYRHGATFYPTRYEELGFDKNILELNDFFGVEYVF